MYSLKKIIKLILLLCIIGWMTFASEVNKNQYTFCHLSFNEGLSQVTVKSILQDSKGFMWIGTYDGLNRYDGKNFTVYRHDPDNIKSISNSNVKELLEDSEGYLWIGTDGGGLNRFDRKNETFITFKNIDGDSESLSGNFIKSIFEDRAKNIWVGTYRGLNLYNKSEGKFKRFSCDENKKGGISGSHINCIAEDSNENLWIGTNTGLNKFNKKTEKAILIKNAERGEELRLEYVFSLYIDSTDDLWIGTLSDGLFKYNEKNGKLIKYNLNKQGNNQVNSLISGIIEVDEKEIWLSTHKDGIKIVNKKSKKIDELKMNLDLPDSLNSNSFLYIYKDRNNLIWMATHDNGINIYDPLRTRFIKNTIKIKEKNNINSNVIWDFYEESENSLWIISGSGLSRYDWENKKHNTYFIQKNIGEKYSNIDTKSILVDSKGVFWIGTATDGLYIFDPEKSSFLKYELKGLENRITGIIQILNGFEDSKGNLWFSTLGRGLIKINENRNKTERFLYDPENDNSIGGNISFIIREDRKGIIWIGTAGGGLNRFDPSTKKFKRYLNIPGDKTSINSNTVPALSISKDNIIWVATTRGFSKFDSVNGTFKRYTKDDGYLDDSVFEITEDNNENIWLAGSRLARFDPRNNSFIFFNKRNGLADGEFNSGAVLKSRFRKNLIYFGSTKGYNIVDTGNIKRNLLAPELVFTKIKINGIEFKPGNNSYLEESISEIKEISLPYKLNNIMLEFIALDFSNPDKNNYAYKIKKINKDWVHLGNSNKVVLTNLRAGRYELLVKGSNNAGIWSEEVASLIINITPPFWATLWFKGLLFLLSIFILLLLFLKGKNKIEQKYKRENIINEIMYKYNISKREREIIDLVVKGMSSKEIEDELYISLSTVNNHIHSILKKMNLKNRGELIVLVKTVKVS